MEQINSQQMRFAIGRAYRCYVWPFPIGKDARPR